MIAIPDEFKANKASEFDGDYMTTLFKLGRDIAVTGDFWQTVPPPDQEP